MTDPEKARAIALGEYTVANRTTVRATAKHFGISKSTVHKELTEKLPELSPALWEKVKALLELNKKERHIRGGLATKQKYEALMRSHQH
ncbi:MAG: sporulation transcriptional regulator SpoIIID [Ruminococcus sp.]|nr:sporulation transcriptional regulator SpoIIID [Ruminococcus sp.]